MSRRPVPGVAKELTHFALLASSGAESQASRADALNQLQALLRLPNFPRQHEVRPALGQAWRLIPPLVFSQSQRIASSAAACLAALGGAIFAAGGALAPTQPAAAEPGKAAGAPAPGRGRKGGRKGGGRGRGRNGDAPPSPAAPAAGQAQRRPAQVPATVLIAWVERLLDGGVCSEGGAAADSSERRAHVLTALRQSVEFAPADVRPRLAMHVLSAARRLLDARGTTAAELGGYLGVMLAAVEAADPKDVAGCLTDMLDTFLGWALTAACKQEDRAMMHQIVHTSKSAWHHAAQPMCDLIATVTSELEALSRAAAGLAAPAADPARDELPVAQRFLTLAALPATMATVMLHHPSPTVAVSAELGRRQLCALMSFCDGMVPPSAGAAPAAADAALRTCLQLAAAWIALLHRVTPVKALAQVLQAPCECPHVAGLMPSALLEEWGLPAAPQPQPAQSSTVTHDTGEGEAVKRLVSSAFASAIAAADGGRTAAAQQPGVRSDSHGVEEPESRAHDPELLVRLPLWLLVLTVLSAALQISFVPGLAAAKQPAEAPSPLTALQQPSSRLQSNAWALLSVLAPLLQPIAALSSQSAVDSTDAVNAPWASSCWQLLLARVSDVLAVPRAGESEVSRAVASCLLSIITLNGGEQAVRHVCDQLAASGLAMAHAVDDSEGDAAQLNPEAARFRHLFCLHLLQTALRKQGAAPGCMRAMATCLASLLHDGPEQRAERDASDAEGMQRRSGMVTQLAFDDALPLVAAATMAVQRAAAGQPLQRDAEMSVCASRVFAYACRLLLRTVAQRESSSAKIAAISSAGATSDSIEQARAVAAHVQHLAPVIGGSRSAATVLHCADLIVLCAARTAAAADPAVSFDLNPAMSGPLPGDKAAASEGAPATPEPPAQRLLALATQLLSSAASLQVLSRQHTATTVAPACLTGASVAGSYAAACQDLLLSLPARPPVANVGGVSAAPGDSELRQAQAAVAAAVDSQLTAALQGAKRTQIRASAAFVLLKELLQTSGEPEARPAKVLVGGGSAATPMKDAETPWTLALKAIAARRSGCLTSAAAIHDALHAMAAALVDAKLKAANSNTGETLVALENFLRSALRRDPALAAAGAGTADSASGGPASDAVVTCSLLPSWPRLPAESTAAAVTPLLFALEQRLLLARSGALMASETPPQKAASLYFFVNGAETDKWFLRVCEPRTLVATAAALPHAAMHAAFVWLRQLLAALQHFAVAAPPAGGKPGHGRHRQAGAAKEPAASQAPKPVKILRAPAGPAVSTPRSVVKVPYARRSNADAAAEPAGDRTAPAPAPPAAPPQEAANPRKMPKRLIASMVQLLAALTTSLVATRDSTTLWRLYRVCTSAVTPALQHVMLAAAAAGQPEAQAEQQPSARAAAEDLLSFVLAAMHQVDGQYEAAATLYSSAVRAAAKFPGLPASHAALCSGRAASCYAALTDWRAVNAAACAAAPLLSAGLRVHCPELQSLQVWALPGPREAEPLVPRPAAAPIHMSAAIDGALAHSQRLLAGLFPQAAPAAIAQVPAAVKQLDAEFSAAFAALRDTHHSATPAMAAELLACTHAAAASAQVLAARLPPGHPPPVPPGWLSAACAAMNPCQHLLAASELLTCGHGRGVASTRHALIAQSALTLQLTPLSRGMHADDAALTGGALDAAQLPVHMHVFGIASALASAREYGVAAPAASGRQLPGKEAVLQALLTIGERGISAALQGNNTGAAKRLVTGLMQSDTVVPLLVAGQSVHTSAHVQEGLLRLQLQKLRYQLALHGSEPPPAPAPAKQPDRAHLPGSSQALNALLPDDLLEDQRGGHAHVAAAAPRPLAALATTSKGMQPLSLASASDELWHSLQPCLQPGAPLLSTLDGSSGAGALASCVQQLAAWTASAGAEAQPAWLPSLRAALRDDGMHARLSQQLQGAEGADWRGLLSEDVATSAPAMTALASAAVSSGEALRSAWLSFGDWMYAHARRARHARRAASASGAPQRAAKAPLTAEDALCYGRVALAYARALSLGSGATTDSTRLLLRLLHFAIHHIDASMQPTLRSALRLVPPATWQVLAPQLFVQLQHSKPHVRAWATELLTALARAVPAAVLYTLVATTADEHAPATPQHAASALLTAVAARDPERVAACRTLLHGLRQLTPVAAESWQNVLDGALAEIRRRMVTLKTEASRLFERSGAADDQLAAAWQRRYTTMLAHGVGRLNALMQEWEGREPTSAHERTIVADFVPALRDAAAAFDTAPTGASAAGELDAQLQPLEALARKVAEPARGPDIDLSHFAPTLCELSPAGGLPVPGTGQDDATIIGVSPTVRLLPSKTRPKRIDLLASNGRTVRFLLKGGEDLQQEQRMQQLLACINSCVQAHGRPGSSFATKRRGGSGRSSGGGAAAAAPVQGRAAACSADLQALVLNVTPLGPGMGLVQWVPRSMTLFDVFKSWQARLLQRHQAAAAAAASAAGSGSNGAASTAAPRPAEEPLPPPHGAAAGRGRGGRARGRSAKAGLPAEITESHRRAMQAATAALASDGTSAAPAAALASPPLPPPPPPHAAVPGIIGLKPAQLVLQQALQDAGHPAQLPRKQWPADVLLSAFRSLVRQAPSQLLASELSTSANDAEHWWAMHNRYTGSLASTSMASYLLGIGDRHLNNVLVVQGTGQVVHIDSAVSFDQGASLRVPEVVPFRLTQMLVAALGPLGAQGTFTTHACTTLAAARAGSSALTSLVDTIVLDPSVDWIAAKRAAAAARGLDSAMALRLWLSHLDETLPGQFARFRDLMQAQLLAALQLAEMLQTAGQREQRAKATADRVTELQDTLSRAAARHCELTQAVQAAHAACLPHKGTLTKHIRFLKEAQPRLESEQQGMLTLWGRLRPREGQRVPAVVAAPPPAWSPDHAPVPLTLFAAQPGLATGMPTSLRAALASQHQLALHSALHTLPPSTLAACEATDALFVQAWPAHTAARQHLAAALAAYLQHVPQLAENAYVGTTSHTAWCRVLHGLEAVVSSAALEEREIVAALQHMPLADAGVATGALQSTLRALGALASVGSVVDDAAEAAGFAAKPVPLADAAAAQLLAAAASQRGALQQGLVQGIAGTAATLECAAAAVRTQEEQQQQAERTSTQDAWGTAADVSGRDVRADPVADALFREGGCAGVLRDVADCLQAVANNKAASTALGSAQSQSLLLAVTTRADTLQSAARDLSGLADAAERAAAAQAFLAHALTPMLRSSGRQPPSAAVELLAAAHARAVQPLRRAVTRLMAALQHAAALRTYAIGLQQEGVSARAAQADVATAAAAADVERAVEQAQAQLGTEGALADAVTAVANERYFDAAMGGNAEGLCVDVIEMAVGTRHGELAAARALIPTLHAVQRELSCAADAGTCGSEGSHAAMHVPAHWREHTAEAQRSDLAAPAQGIWGAPIWGGSSGAPGAAASNIWGGLPGAGAVAASATDVQWPTQLNSRWAPCAALFALDAVLQGAVAREAGSSGVLCPRLASQPQGALVDTAERCVADMLACGPAAVAAARLRQLTDELVTPPVAAPLPVPALAPEPLSSQLPPPPAVYPPQRPSGAPQPPAHQLQSLGRVPAHTAEPAQQDGRQLESFTFFDTDVGGADIMLGGLSDSSSLEAQSVGGDSALDAGDRETFGTDGPQGAAAQHSRFSFHDDELPGTAMPLQSDADKGVDSDADELTPADPQDASWLPHEADAQSANSRAASGLHAGPGTDSAAAAPVAQLFSTLVTRRVPALAGPSRSTSAVSDAPAATGAGADDALPPLPRSCLERLNALTAAQYAALAQETRCAIWLLSHLLPADLTPLVAATVPKKLAKSVFEDLTSARLPAGVRVHALVTSLQHAAATMFDARQALAQWRASYDEASSALLQHLSSCGSALHSSARDAAQAAQQWSGGVAASTASLLDDLTAGVLSLEASRAGQAWGPGAAQDSLLQTLPQVVRDMSAAAVKAAAAQAHLNGVQNETQSLEAAVDNARASLPDQKAAAEAAATEATQHAAAAATESSKLRADVGGLASELPTLVDTMHADLRQSMRDLGLLPKAHVADVVKLCNQITRSWQLKKPGFALLAQSAHELLEAAGPLAPPPHGSARAKQHVKDMRSHLLACAAPATALLDAARDLFAQTSAASLHAAHAREQSLQEWEGNATLSVVGGALGMHVDELSRLQRHGATGGESQNGGLPHAPGLEEVAAGVAAAACELHDALGSIRQAATDVTTALHDHAFQTRQPQASGSTYVQKMDRNRMTFAKGVMQRTTAKVHGLTASGRTLPVEEHAQVLIAQATSSQRLSRMYEGWTSWL